MDRELQRCPNCGREELLYAQNNWCDCGGASAKAPWRMVPQSVTETVDAMLKSIEEKEKRLAHIRAIKRIK